MRVKRQDAQLIQVESRCSTTAARSNEWVPINPGAEGALALGIAYVIIKEKLYNENFVEKYTDGFETVTTSSGATEPGFKHFIIENYHPYQMSKITGVSVEKIIMLAKLITRMKPAVAVYDQTLTQYSNGIDNILAVNALNALIGSIDNPGGILKQRKLPESETDGKFSQSKNTKFNSFNLNDEFTFEGGKNNMQVLFIYNSNPVYNSADHKKFLQWMKKIPLTVSFSTIWDETAEASTLVLPEHHFLEKLEDVPASKAFPYPVNGLSQPVTQKPLYDTNHFIDILTGIALKTGEPLISQFSGFSSDMLVKNYFEKVYTSKRGTIFTNKFDTAQVRTMEERGWWTDFHKSFPAFWDELKKQGGWWDPTYTNGEWGRIFSTQTRKYEFFPKNPDIRMTFPHYEKTIFSSQSANYPFYLNVFEPLSFSGGTGGDLPWALENPASSISTFWEAWVEINPETAKSLNISDGDQVFVESASGRIQATAKYFPASKPDVISMPSGFGRKSFCPEIPSAGSNVLNILCSNKQRFSTKPALLSTMVKVYKI
jgi:anaerobic selenocysteine-containing dehydrogenase